MPYVKVEDRYLLVLNIFTTDSAEKQSMLINEMSSIVDTADFQGWISSTVHAGQDKFGTANFIQWRSRADLALRYAEDKFKHATIPLFSDISTSMKLLQTEIAFTQRHPSYGEVNEVGPHRDDYTAIEIFGCVDPSGLADLVETLSSGQEHLLDVPGYRSHIVAQGVGSRFFDDRAFAVVYSQWDSKEAYDAYRAVPEAEQVEDRRKSQARVAELADHYEWNTYRPVHSRSAGDA